MAVGVLIVVAGAAVAAFMLPGSNQVASGSTHRVVLRGANLTDADLAGATLRGADLTGSVLRGADLRGRTCGRRACVGWTSQGQG